MAPGYGQKRHPRRRPTPSRSDPAPGTPVQTSPVDALTRVVSSSFCHVSSHLIGPWDWADVNVFLLLESTLGVDSNAVFLVSSFLLCCGSGCAPGGGKGGGGRLAEKAAILEKERVQGQHVPHYGRAVRVEKVQRRSKMSNTGRTARLPYEEHRREMPSQHTQ